MSEVNASDYQKSLTILSEIVGKTLSVALKASRGIEGITGLQDAAARVRSELDLISNTLGTIQNWIRLQETALASLGSIEKWASIVAEENDIDAIRHRLRIMLLPQVETFVQSISSADKASRVALPIMSADLSKIPALIEKLSSINVHLLELIDYEPSTKSSLLDSGVNALYLGAMDDFQDRIDRLEKNMQAMTQASDE